MENERNPTQRVEEHRQIYGKSSQKKKKKNAYVMLMIDLRQNAHRHHRQVEEGLGLMRNRILLHTQIS